ncbi:MAG TPA: PAS domain-containing protein, partial [Aquihabitans sp.]|nr:PAS domain-containing protein [Aquihabitans sp.]
MRFSTTSASAAGPERGPGTSPLPWVGLRRRARAFDALGLPAVALDRHGTIVAVNAAWSDLAVQGDPPIGLAVGDEYRAPGAPDAGPRDRLAERRVAAGLAEVVGGRRALFEVERRWPWATEERWFLVRAAAAAIDDGHGAVVVHLDITGRKHLEERIG